jgi:uncharacterized membrane protein
VKILLRAALVGAASGARSLTGLAALALHTPAAATAQPDRLLGASRVQALVTTAALVELGLDKLPQTPSRLTPAGLGMRIATGAAAGTIVARREPGSGLAGEAAAAAVAAGSAVGAAWLGARWRETAARRLGRDYIGAVLEDGCAVSLAWAASRG